MSLDKVRIGMIGSGFMGRTHSECYSSIPHAELHSVASRSGERARDLAEQFGYRKWTADYREVLADPDVDLVDITVPNYLHEEVSVAAARAGKDFILEKPLARNLAEGRAILEAVRASGVNAMYAENVPFNPSFKQARQIIAQGGIGKVFMMRTNELHNGPSHSAWFWDGEAMGGGALIDMGCHELSGILRIMGSDVVRVYAEMGTLKWQDTCQNGAEDTSMVTLRFADGGVAQLADSWAVSGGMDSRWEIYGTEGSIFIDQSRQTNMLTYSQNGWGPSLTVEASKRPHVASTQGWSYPLPDGWHVFGHFYELEHFVQCKLTNTRAETTLEEGYRVLEVLDAAYRSAQTGQPQAIRG